MTEAFIELECAIGLDKHFYKEPISLFPCGHSICKECVLMVANEVVKCKICGGVNTKDLKEQMESDHAKKLFQSNLEKLFPVLNERISSIVNQLKGKYSSFALQLK